MEKVNKQELRRLAEECEEKGLSFKEEPMMTCLGKLAAKANPTAILSLLDELERLEANHNQLNHGVAVAATSEWNRLAEENDQLRAELEQYRKDAQRYRWITENAEVDCRVLAEGDFNSLDERIDAAMAKEGGSNG